MMGGILLDARNLTRTLEGEIRVTLVKDVSLSIEAEHFTAVTGPSGSGKSSLLYLLGLLDKPTTGSIHVEGIETTKLSEDRLAQFRLEKKWALSSSFIFCCPNSRRWRMS